MKEIPMKWIEETCKIGQMADCCRYLTVGPEGFICQKNTSLKATIDAQVDVMNAKSDNCRGWDIESQDH